MLQDFAIKPKPTSIKNPQSNAIIERVHQVVGDMLRVHDLQNYAFDKIDPWGPILQNIAYAIRSTYHTTTEATPGQLVFGRDMLFDIPFTADWTKIEQKRQKIINKSNITENDKRVDYDYEVDDEVFIYRDGHYRKLEGPFLGPFRIVQIYTNGTVRIRRGTTSERLSIRRLTPNIVEKR